MKKRGQLYKWFIIFVIIIWLLPPWLFDLNLFVVRIKISLSFLLATITLTYDLYYSIKLKYNFSSIYERPGYKKEFPGRYYSGIICKIVLIIAFLAITIGVLLLSKP